MGVLIGGGTGLIGRALTAKLLQDGATVYHVTRTPKKKSDISWSELQRNGFPLDVTHVVNLAGTPISTISPKFCSSKSYADYKEELLTSRTSTNKILTSCIANQSNVNVKALVCASAVGFYKPDLQTTYTEDSLYEPYGFLQSLCAQVEASARVPEKPDVRQIQMRIGVVLSRDGGALQKMEPAFWLGLGGRVGSGEQWMPWIHISDAVGLFQHALFSPNLKSGPLNATAPNPVRQMQFAKTFASVLGRPAIIPMPGFVAKILLQDRAEILLEGAKVLPRRALQEGYQFSYPDLLSALKDLYGKT